ncbi:MAG: class I SAM-dependent methyltransferase [Candidatus Sumerlaeia bacterium]|nr:class I SAM-dependent methyltransferase [Candidatus Sumerlaeia bacterium]
MKIRDSGMPPEEMWSGFFSPGETLRRLGLSEITGDVVDIGCGYGTFSILAARLVRGKVYALDIEQEMIDAVKRKATEQTIQNLEPIRCDFMTAGSLIPDASVDAVLLFNILHTEDPVSLLREAHRILRTGGMTLVTHWSTDKQTPRGPSLEIRPTAEQCAAWAQEAGLTPSLGPIDLPPHHYGLAFTKQDKP